MEDIKQEETEIIETKDEKKVLKTTKSKPQQDGEPPAEQLIPNDNLV